MPCAMMEKLLPPIGAGIYPAPMTKVETQE